MTLTPTQVADLTSMRTQALAEIHDAYASTDPRDTPNVKIEITTIMRDIIRTTSIALTEDHLARISRTLDSIAITTGLIATKEHQ